MFAIFWSHYWIPAQKPALLQRQCGMTAVFLQTGLAAPPSAPELPDPLGEDLLTAPVSKASPAARARRDACCSKPPSSDSGGDMLVHL